MSSSLPAETYSILENPQPDIWDSFLIINSLGNFWQTIDYGESFKQLYPRTRTARLIATRDGVTEGIVQGIFSKFFGFGTIMNIQEGPLLRVTSNDKYGVLKSIIPALEKFGVKNRVFRIEIQWPSKWGHVDLFRNMGYEHIGTKTAYTVDLSKGAEELWRHIYGNKRRNIKKAVDRGVEFIETSSFEDIEKFYGLFLDLAKRHKFVPTQLSWFQSIWKSRREKDMSKIFFARWRNNIVSSVFATIHAKTIYALGWGYLGTALEVRPNDLLHWKIMEWGCKRGFLRYYMGNVQPNHHAEKGSHEAGIWRWKREWNGDLDPIYIFRKSISKFGLIERVYDRFKR
jgi:lipid II:glycine glycyltransferase (peptidoglycan interpeptide bridge formation enzyme)